MTLGPNDLQLWSPVIYSSDDKLFGYVESIFYSNGDVKYIARVFSKVGVHKMVDEKSFTDELSAHQWVADNLDCPLFTLLSK